MKLLLFALFAFLCASTGNALEKARFDNYRVYEISIDSDEQLQLMREIENFPDGYQFWEFASKVGNSVELVVPPHKFGEFSELVEKFELKTRKMISNLQEVFDNEQPMRQTKAIDWTSYARYAEITTWMDELVAQYPAYVTPIYYGRSYENRELRAVKINIGGNEASKSSVVLEATIHAREWASTATTTWILNEILKTTDPEAQEVARSFVWYVFPVTNPDGYAYTWDTNRSWRKTRRPSSPLCFGADPNRNWDHYWMQGGASSNPCVDNYGGAYAFSEPEALLLSEYLKTIPRLSAYFAFHSYGQMMMTPYGYSTARHPRYQEMYDIGAKGVAALTAKYGTYYRLGSIANVIYIASGSSVDWVDYHLRSNVTYAYEFRDEGQYGFSLPANQIIPNSIEVWASVMAIMQEAKARGLA